MKSGVYMITCATNGDRYIGSSKSMKVRKRDHWISLRTRTHHNSHMQSVWNKYGESSFVFEILEEVEIQFLLEREQYWLDTLKPELNKAIKAESGFLGLKHTEQTRKRLSEIQKNRLQSPGLIEKLRNAAIEQNKRQPNPNKGKRMSEEQKSKLRNATLMQFSSEEGRKKHSDAMKRWMTPEMRKRISDKKRGKKLSSKAIEAMKKSFQKVWDSYSEEGRKKRVEKMRKATIQAKAKNYYGFVDPNGQIYRDVYNLSDFCRVYDLSTSEMSNVNSGKRKSHKGWTRLVDGT